MTKKNTARWKSIVAGFLAGVYSFTQIAGAHAAEAGFWENRRQSRSVHMAALPAVFPAAAPLAAPAPAALPPAARASLGWLPALAAAYGEIGEVHLAGPKAPLVIHVQDVHEIEEAQRRQSGFLTALAQSGRVGLAGLEGGAGAFRLSPYRDYPEAVRRPLADAFLSLGYLTGPEHAAVTGAKPLTLWGVEDMALYQAHMDAFAASEKTRPARLALLAEEIRASDAAAAKTFSPALKEFDAAAAAFHKGEIPLADFAARLFAVVPAGGHAQAELFGRALSAEARLDFTVVEKDRRALVEALTRRLSRAETAGLMEDSLRLRAGAMGVVQYQEGLRRLCAAHGLALTPALQDYADYLALAEKIDRAALWRELADLERRAEAALAKTPAEKTLAAARRQLGLRQKLAAHQLTPDEWAQYRAAGPAWKSYEDFCRLALERNDALAGKLLAKMRAENTSAAVLVAGGFHTPGLLANLKKAGVSYAVFTPRLSNLPSEQKTLDVFARQPLPLEKILAGETINLAFPQMLNPAARQTPVADARYRHVAPLAAALADTLARGSLDLAETQRLARLHFTPLSAEAIDVAGADSAVLYRTRETTFVLTAARAPRAAEGLGEPVHTWKFEDRTVRMYPAPMPGVVVRRAISATRAAWGSVSIFMGMLTASPSARGVEAVGTDPVEVAIGLGLAILGLFILQSRWTPDWRGRLSQILHRGPEGPAIRLAGGSLDDGQHQRLNEAIAADIRRGAAATLFAHRPPRRPGDRTLVPLPAGTAGSLLADLRSRRLEAVRGHKLDENFDVVFVKHEFPVDAALHPGRARGQAYWSESLWSDLTQVYAGLPGPAQRRLFLDILIEAFQHEAAHAEHNEAEAAPLLEHEVERVAPSARPRALFRVVYAARLTAGFGIKPDYEAFLRSAMGERSSYIHAYMGLSLEDHQRMASELLKVPGRHTQIMAQLHAGAILADPHRGEVGPRVLRMLRAHGAVDIDPETHFHVTDQQLTRDLVRQHALLKSDRRAADMNVLGTQFAQFEPWDRGDGAHAGDSVLLPAPGAKTALPLTVQEARRRILDHPAFGGRGSSVAEKNRLRRIARRLTAGPAGDVQISREDLEALGQYFLSRVVITRSAGGKGQRYARIDFTEDGRRVVWDAAKGTYHIPVDGGRSILEVGLAQIHAMNERPNFGKPVDLDLHTSHFTDADIKKELHRLGYRPRRLGRIASVLGSWVRLGAVYVHPSKTAPKVRLFRVRKAHLFDAASGDFYKHSVTVGEAEPQEWSGLYWPDAHDTSFIDFIVSGRAHQALAEGRLYQFVANVDNLAALPDPAILAMVWLTDSPLANELAEQPRGATGGSAVHFKPGMVPAMVAYGQSRGLLEKFQFDQKFLRETQESGQAAHYFPLFNTATYTTSILGFARQAFWPGASETEVRTELHRFYLARGKPAKALELAFKMLDERRRRMQLWEEDKVHPALQPSHLAGMATWLVKTLFVEVPEGAKAGKESHFEPLKENLDNFKAERDFVSALSQTYPDGALLEHVPEGARGADTARLIDMKGRYRGVTLGALRDQLEKQIAAIEASLKRTTDRHPRVYFDAPRVSRVRHLGFFAAAGLAVGIALVLAPATAWAAPLVFFEPSAWFVAAGYIALAVGLAAGLWRLGARFGREEAWHNFTHVFDFLRRAEPLEAALSPEEEARLRGRLVDLKAVVVKNLPNGASARLAKEADFTKPAAPLFHTAQSLLLIYFAHGSLGGIESGKQPFSLDFLERLGVHTRRLMADVLDAEPYNPSAMRGHVDRAMRALRREFDLQQLNRGMDRIERVWDLPAKMDEQEAGKFLEDLADLAAGDWGWTPEAAAGLARAVAPALDDARVHSLPDSQIWATVARVPETGERRVEIWRWPSNPLPASLNREFQSPALPGFPGDAQLVGQAVAALQEESRGGHGRLRYGWSLPDLDGARPYVRFRLAVPGTPAASPAPVGPASAARPGEGQDWLVRAVMETLLLGQGFVFRRLGFAGFSPFMLSVVPPGPDGASAAPAAKAPIGMNADRRKRLLYFARKVAGGESLGNSDIQEIHVLLAHVDAQANSRDLESMRVILAGLKKYELPLGQQTVYRIYLEAVDATRRGKFEEAGDLWLAHREAVDGWLAKGVPLSVYRPSTGGALPEIMQLSAANIGYNNDRARALLEVGKHYLELGHYTAEETVRSPNLGGSQGLAILVEGMLLVRTEDGAATPDPVRRKAALEEALGLFERAEAILTNSALPAAQIAGTYLRLGRHREVRRKLKAALARWPEAGVLHALDGQERLHVAELALESPSRKAQAASLFRGALQAFNRALTAKNPADVNRDLVHSMAVTAHLGLARILPEPQAAANVREAEKVLKVIIANGHKDGRFLLPSEIALEGWIAHQERAGGHAGVLDLILDQPVVPTRGGFLAMAARALQNVAKEPEVWLKGILAEAKKAGTGRRGAAIAFLGDLGASRHLAYITREAVEAKNAAAAAEAFAALGENTELLDFDEVKALAALAQADKRLPALLAADRERRRAAWPARAAEALKAPIPADPQDNPKAREVQREALGAIRGQINAVRAEAAELGLSPLPGNFESRVAVFLGRLEKAEKKLVAAATVLDRFKNQTVDGYVRGNQRERLAALKVQLEAQVAELSRAEPSPFAADPDLAARVELRREYIDRGLKFLDFDLLTWQVAVMFLQARLDDLTDERFPGAREWLAELREVRDVARKLSADVERLPYQDQLRKLVPRELEELETVLTDLDDAVAEMEKAGRWPWLQSFYDAVAIRWGWTAGQAVAPAVVESGLAAAFFFTLTALTGAPILSPESAASAVAVRLVWQALHIPGGTWRDAVSADKWIVALGTHAILGLGAALGAPTFGAMPAAVALAAFLLPHLAMDAAQVRRRAARLEDLSALHVLPIADAGRLDAALLGGPAARRLPFRIVAPDLRALAREALGKRDAAVWARARLAQAVGPEMAEYEKPGEKFWEFLADRHDGGAALEDQRLELSWAMVWIAGARTTSFNELGRALREAGNTYNGRRGLMPAGETLEADLREDKPIALELTPAMLGDGLPTAADRAQLTRLAVLISKKDAGREPVRIILPDNVRANDPAAVRLLGRLENYKVVELRQIRNADGSPSVKNFLRWDQGSSGAEPRPVPFDMFVVNRSRWVVEGGLENTVRLLVDVLGGFVYDATRGLAEELKALTAVRISA